jgi:hypothetical protein
MLTSLSEICSGPNLLHLRGAVETPEFAAFSATTPVSKPDLCVCGMIAQYFLKNQFSLEILNLPDHGAIFT